ncbi:DUF1648 domain-containing protein [Pseudonocardia broussonetiae]|uniref:DUF1648 domain-containing protein n=1 Tax=Pseudonocardia broussonetiae TaxID=2736640 RepID=A0A6M6JEX9_9PSEU|nr:DUF1648 domain-containing protein [Pseudonocardia broussonetiae]QJY45362.1 DUF1648 domain-containing protein [Pseudonocardia broussonetiae]
MPRTRLLAAVPHLPAQLPACALLVLAADRLPDPVASHFALDGTADGYTGRVALLAVQIGLALFLTVLFGLLAGSARGARSATGPDGGRLTVGLSWAVAALVGVITCAAAAANLDLADAADAVLEPWWLAAGLVAGAAVGWVVHRLTPASPTAAPAAPAAVPAVELGDTERASWSRTVVSRPLAGLGAALLLGAAALGPVGAPLVAVVALAAAGLLVAATSAVRVTVDRRGLRVGLGPVGWPRIVVPLSDVASAMVDDVSAAEFGGWGYRVVPGGSGVVLRSGPALVVVRRSGRRFAVTVDDPQTAAGLLNGILAC